MNYKIQSNINNTNQSILNDLYNTSGYKIHLHYNGTNFFSYENYKPVQYRVVTDREPQSGDIVMITKAGSIFGNESIGSTYIVDKYIKNDEYTKDHILISAISDTMGEYGIAVYDGSYLIFEELHK